MQAVVHNWEGERFIDLSRDIPALERAVNQLGDVKAILIDPISAYMGRINTLHNSAVRACLGPLAAMADKYGIAIICVSHLNKKQDLKAVYRAMDSLAFVAAARAVWWVCPDQSDPERERKFFLPVKTNLAHHPRGLAFRLTEDKGPVFENLEIDYSPDDLMSGGQYEARNAVGEARAWLKDVLSNGPIWAQDVCKMAGDAGIKARTLYRAKKELGIRSSKETSGGSTRWTWDLAPAVKTEPPPPELPL